MKTLLVTKTFSASWEIEVTDEEYAKLTMDSRDEDALGRLLERTSELVADEYEFDGIYIERIGAEGDPGEEIYSC